MKKLTPYAHIGVADDTLLPRVEGLNEDIRIAVFNEEYVNQYVFMEDELVKNSFEIFVKTPRYDELTDEINELISSIRTMFDDTPELETLIISSYILLPVITPILFLSTMQHKATMKNCKYIG